MLIYFPCIHHCNLSIYDTEIKAKDTISDNSLNSFVATIVKEKDHEQERLKIEKSFQILSCLTTPLHVMCKYTQGTPFTCKWHSNSVF